MCLTDTDLFQNDNLLSSPELNIENKERSSLMPWKGQFSPQLVEYLLKKYSDANSKVFDPFLGSGTVLIESARIGVEACGVELNPAAFKMSKIYHCCNIEPSFRKESLESLDKHLNKFMRSYSNKNYSSDDLFINLLEISHLLSNEVEKDILEVLVLLSDPKEKTLTKDRLLNLWNKLKNMIHNLPFVNTPIRAYNADSRNLGFLKEKKYNLVITSPPYINVFNYHQQKRFSVEALGNNVLDIARSEIGSNRKNRGNRFLTVTQYCLDMALILKEISSKLTDDAKIIFIVGRESNVRKTSFFNSKIIASIGNSLGISLVESYEREFKNRFGKIIKEDILILRNTSNISFDENKIREIANITLKDAAERAPDDSMQDLLKAISAISNIKPSELYQSKNLSYA